MDDCELKLGRAEALIGGLGDEQKRWDEKAEILKISFTKLIGDLMLCSGIIAYLGIFTGQYRSDCIN